MLGQQPANPIDSVTVDTDLVVTWAQITRRDNGAPITGLSIGDFILREQGKQQHISLVTQDQPLSIIFLVDGMACLYPPEREFRRAREALQQLGDDAEIALMAWDSDVSLMQQLTKDRDAIIDRLQDKASFFHALNGPAKVVRTTRDLYRPGEAIYQAAAYLEKAASPGRRKIIITLVNSYGPPVAPLAATHWHSATEVSELLEKTGTTVYGLYLTERRYHDGNLPLIGGFGPKTRSRQSGGSLEKFVELTGGYILDGKREQSDEWLIRLTGLIRSAYSVGYYPDDKNFNGRFRKIKLELSVQGKTKSAAVQIKTRVGYHAIRPPSRILSSSPNESQP
jgi:VWFA-related protein